MSDPLMRYQGFEEAEHVQAYSDTDPEPTPWGLGLVVAAMVAAITVLLVVSLGYALVAIHPLLAITLGATMTAGFTGPIGQWRDRIVLRWVAAGIGAGATFGWCVILWMTIAQLSG